MWETAEGLEIGLMVEERNVYDMSVSSTCVTCGPTHPFEPTMWAAAGAAKIESHTVKMMLVVVRRPW